MIDKQDAIMMLGITVAEKVMKINELEAWLADVQEENRQLREQFARLLANAGIEMPQEDGSMHHMDHGHSHSGE